jgi:hypothetical protein
VLHDSAAYLFDLVRKYDIEAEAERAGWVQPVHSPRRLKLAEKRVKEWSALGAAVELLDRRAVSQMLGRRRSWQLGGSWPVVRPRAVSRTNCPTVMPPDMRDLNREVRRRF